MYKRFALGFILMFVVGCGEEDSTTNNTTQNESTNNQSTGNNSPSGDCRNDNDCNFDGAGDSTSFLDTSNVSCRETDSGSQCSECLSDDDCPSGHKCSSQVYCINVQ